MTFFISGGHVWDHFKYWPIKVPFVFIEDMFRNQYTGGSMWAKSDSTVTKTDDLQADITFSITGKMYN